MSLQTRISALANSIANDIKSLISGKQDKLINTTNIKSINSNSLIGSGDLIVYGSRTFTFGGTGTPVIGNDVTPRVVTNFAGKFTSVRLSVKTAPVGGSFSVTIEQSTAVTFTTPTVVATILLAASATTKVSVINVSVIKNAFLRLNITAVNGAADWTVELLETE